jgi:hypothetical protein
MAAGADVAITHFDHVLILYKWCSADSKDDMKIDGGASS